MAQGDANGAAPRSQSGRSIPAQSRSRRTREAIETTNLPPSMSALHILQHEHAQVLAIPLCNISHSEQRTCNSRERNAVNRCQYQSARVRGKTSSCIQHALTVEHCSYELAR